MFLIDRLSRRNFFKQVTLSISSLFLLSYKSGQSFAAPAAENFIAGDFAASFDRLFANQIIVDSDKINIELPKVAENGAVVPITISSDLDNIDRLYVWVEKNPTPLAIEFSLSPNAMLYITARIKMAESCNVILTARQGNQWLHCRQWVDVMLGGCGTG